MGKFGAYESAADTLQREYMTLLDARLEALEEDERARESSPWARLAKLEAALVSESRSRRTTTTGSKGETRVEIERDSGRRTEIIGDPEQVEKFAARLRDNDAIKRARTGRIEVRSTATGTTVSGYASIFGVLSEELFEDGLRFREKVAPGCFKRSLADGDKVSLLLEHTGLPLASSTSGTLKLREDTRGLHFRSTLDGNDPDCARILPKLKRRDVCQCSFAFIARADSWDLREKIPVRTLKDARLTDVSLVGRPAYPQTEATVT